MSALDKENIPNVQSDHKTQRTRKRSRKALQSVLYYSRLYFIFIIQLINSVKEPVDVHYFCLYLILLVLICSLKSKTGFAAAMHAATNGDKLTLCYSRVHRNFAATITGITRKTLWGVCKRTSGCYLWGYAKVTVLFIHELFVCSKIQSLRGEEDYCHYNVDYHFAVSIFPYRLS
jgi:hypothetical protein